MQRSDAILRSGLCATAALGMLCVAAGPAAAAESDTISVELNRLQQVEDSCRMSLVFTNGLTVGIAALELEAVVFDAEGRAERFLLLKSEPLIPGKVRVHQYNLSATACTGIGSILVNDVVSCEGEGLDPASCLRMLRPSSREAADLYMTVRDGEPEVAADRAE